MKMFYESSDVRKTDCQFFLLIANVGKKTLIDEEAPFTKNYPACAVLANIRVIPIIIGLITPLLNQ